MYTVIRVRSLAALHTTYLGHVYNLTWRGWGKPRATANSTPAAGCPSQWAYIELDSKWQAPRGETLLLRVPGTCPVGVVRALSQEACIAEPTTRVPCLISRYMPRTWYYEHDPSGSYKSEAQLEVRDYPGLTEHVDHCVQLHHGYAPERVVMFLILHGRKVVPYWSSIMIE